MQLLMNYYKPQRGISMQITGTSNKLIFVVAVVIFTLFSQFYFNRMIEPQLCHGKN